MQNNFNDFKSSDKYANNILFSRFNAKQKRITQQTTAKRENNIKKIQEKDIKTKL